VFPDVLREHLFIEVIYRCIQQEAGLILDGQKPRKTGHSAMEFLVPLVISSLIFGIVGCAIGDLGGKKNGKKGMALGALLGPIGCIIVAILPPGEGSAVKNEKQQAVELERRKVALLEAQLAELKKDRAPATSSRTQRVEALLDEPPVYRLD
jgi:hypothetical protein